MWRLRRRGGSQDLVESDQPQHAQDVAGDCGECYVGLGGVSVVASGDHGGNTAGVAELKADSSRRTRQRRGTGGNGLGGATAFMTAFHPVAGAEAVASAEPGEVLVVVAVVSQGGLRQEHLSGDLFAVVAGAGVEVAAQAGDEVEAVSADAVGVGHAQPR